MGLYIGHSGEGRGKEGVEMDGRWVSTTRYAKRGLLVVVILVAYTPFLFVYIYVGIYVCACECVLGRRLQYVYANIYVDVCVGVCERRDTKRERE